MKAKTVKKNFKNLFSLKWDKDLLCFVLLGVLAVLFLTTFVFQSVQTSKLKKQIAEQMNTQIVEKINEINGQINVLAQNTARASIIYVYSPDVLVSSSPEIVTIQKDYLKKTAELTAEIEEAGPKIQNLKNGKVKEDFSELYLQSLTSKRDTLVEEYQKQLQDITLKVNQALENVMSENNIPAVFDSKILLGRSGQVIDITNVVLQKFEELIKAK